jgi:hypothetical protein
VTLLGRDAGEIEALVTDRYLDALLAGASGPPSTSEAADRSDRRALDAAVRAASRRLAGDLPRFHPSFRFEERLALRLAEAAAAMRLPMAAGSESQIGHIPVAPGHAFDPLEVLPDDDAASLDMPTLIRGAVAASAISLAGAAWLAWRRRAAAPRSPLARAARAAHSSSRPMSRAGRA